MTRYTFEQLHEMSMEELKNLAETCNLKDYTLKSRIQLVSLLANPTM